MNIDTTIENDPTENKDYITSFLSQLRKHWIIAIASFLLPIIICYFLATSSSAFQSRMLVRTDFFSVKELGHFFQNFSEAVTDKDYARLSREYHLENKYAEKLLSIQLNRLKDKKESFVINMAVSDTSVIKPIEKCITNYFNTNPYMLDMLSSKRKIYSDALDSIQNALKDVVLLKQLAYTKDLDSRVVPYYMTAVNASFNGLREKELNLRLEMSMEKGFVVIEGFGVPSQTKTELTKKYLIFGIGMGILCCIFMVNEIMPRLRKDR